MTQYQTAIDAIRELKAKFGNTWADISAEDAAVQSFLCQG